MNVKELKEIKQLAEDLCVKESLDKILISMTYDEAHKIIMKEYDKKWEECFYEELKNRCSWWN